MRKLFNNRPWKEWPTRKLAFTVVSLVWLAYAIAGLTGQDTNETITTTIVYKGGIWILTFGIILVLSDKVAEKLLKLFKNHKLEDYSEEDEEDGNEE